MNKNMDENRVSKRQNSQASTRSFLLSRRVVTIAIILIFLMLADTFVTGFAKFTYNTVRCGRVPVVIKPGSDFASGYPPNYIVPGDRYYQFSAASTFVYTEREAQDQHINIDPFTEEGSRCREK